LTIEAIIGLVNSTSNSLSSANIILSAVVNVIPDKTSKGSEYQI